MKTRNLVVALGMVSSLAFWACSGEEGVDGVNGADGTSCYAKALKDSSGFELYCGDEYVGTLKNGEDGAKGDAGAPGENGKNGLNGDNGKNGTSCTVEPLASKDGYKVICAGDSIGVLVNGTNGANGENGANGTNGENGLSAYEIAVVNGFKGTEEEWVASLKGDKGDQGAPGENGKNGLNGENGKNGTSCTVEPLASKDGYKVICAGDSVGVVLNGINGTNGTNGTNGENGLSAYEIAKADGYTGTEEDWIESLKGDPGAAGTSCTAEEVTGGVKITCTDGKTYTLNNGTDGKDGRNFDEGWMVDHRDYHIYKIVTIGTQTWMAHNLNYETEMGSYCYKDSAKYCEKYGRLYTWAAAMDSVGTWSTNSKGCGRGTTCSPTYPVRGVCPEGWHLPTKAEFETLVTAVGGGGIAGKVLKSTSGWNSSGNGTDAFAFSALPVGYRSTTGAYYNEGGYAGFWSSTEDNSSSYNYSSAYHMYLMDFCGDAFRDPGSKHYGYSVRCLRD